MRDYWWVGGGINAPLKVQLQMIGIKARNLNQIGNIQNTLKETEEISN